MPDVTDSVSRDPMPTGYWDHPVRTLERDAATTRFVQFFDWDELAHRGFNYAQVQIVRSPQHNELVGRFALLEFGHVRFQLLDTAT